MDRRRPPFLLFILAVLTTVFLATSCDRPVGEFTTQSFGPAPGVTPTSIRIGSSLPLTGHASFLGTQTLVGAEAYIRHINDTGGIHGRTIELMALDDAYDPPRCLANTQRLIVEEEAFALSCYVGTPTTAKVLPLISESGIPLVGMFTGANALREPYQKQLVNIRASYYQETAAAVRYLVEDLGLTRIAVFYQYDAYGFDGLKGTELALLDHELQPVVAASYIRGSMDVASPLSKILAAKPEAVVMIGTYRSCAAFIKLAHQLGEYPVFHNVSFVGAEELARLLQDEADGGIVSQVVPPPNLPESRELLTEVNEYFAHLASYFPMETPNSVSLEGYINARVLVEGLRRAGPHLTRASFLAAIESIQALPLGPDYEVTFGPGDNQGLDRVYFTKIQHGELSLLTEFKSTTPGTASADEGP